EELGVQYVLEGSVRKAGDKIRITAQLIDALTGHHLWAERYGRNLKDIFAVQDEITKKIFTALQVKLTEGEHARLWGKGTDNLDAYLKYVQAREHWRRFVSKETNAQARQMIMKAIALDPNYPVAYGQLGYTHWADLIMNWSESRKNSMEQLVESCQKAMALDDSIPMLYTLQANIYLMKKQFNKALAEGERAVSMCPNCTENKVLLGHILRFMGKPEEAI
ncbi:MAG: adenylate/guanylate cyclase domain-containing protein, partial [Deltaproteobacteria bacterium]